MSKISENFYHEHFVPKAIYKQYGASSLWFISPFMVRYAEFLVKRFGKKIIINNWMDGGVLENRGFRVPTYPGGGALSQHKFKSALDTNVEGKTPEEVDADIKANFVFYSEAGLTTVEDIAFTSGDVVGDFHGWNHGDCRQTGMATLLIVKP